MPRPFVCAIISDVGEPRDKRSNRLICACLVLLTLAVYWQVWDFEFVRVDDHQYVTGNPHVLAGLSPQTVRWAITGIGAANWHPLTWISLMADTDLARFVTSVLDTDLGRDNSGVYHLTNVAFHLANVVLLFLLLNRMTGFRWRSAPKAFGVALLFGIHPLHVESVAWVSERKDVLSTLFWLLTMWAYVSYVEKPEMRRYALVAVFLALGLMAKPMLVTLPIVLLLMDYWPLRRGRGSGARGQGPESSGQWTVDSGQAESDQNPTPNTRHPVPNVWPLIREKLPLFAIAAVSCVVTFYVQRAEGAVAQTDYLPLSVRVGNALVSYVAYIQKAVWPRGLAAFYPYTGEGAWLPAVAASGAALAILTYLALRAFRKRPEVTVGWLWYVVTLAPVVGIVQVGAQAMADRYTYVPLIGLFIPICWLFPEKPGGMRVARIGSAVLAAVVAAGLMVCAYRQVGHWRNDVAIWTHTLGVVGENPRVRFRLGCAYDDAGDFERAVADYRAALRMRPNDSDTRNNLGCALGQLGRLDEAVRELKEAARLDPSDMKTCGNLAMAEKLRKEQTGRGRR